MRIEGPERPDLLIPSDGNEPKRPATRPTDSSGTSAENVRIGGAECKPYIQKASDCDEVNRQAVAEAKKLIESGQLDTPEAAKKAAERIISMGI